MSSTDVGKLPKPGLRNIKTALSVFLCVLLFDFIGRPNPLFACSAAIICMKETVRYSYRKGADRLIGTLLGGAVGLVFLLLKTKLTLLYGEAILAGLGIFTVIYLSNLVDKKETSIISSIVVVAIVIGAREKSPFLYAFDRMVDTSVGIVIALLVNKYVFPYKNNENQQPGVGADEAVAGASTIQDKGVKKLSTDSMARDSRS
ncbi:MAG TPA: aromatic acid exporter family protein [bacterium]|nr:aromatic acid exporter family protein [bacterium]